MRSAARTACPAWDSPRLQCFFADARRNRRDSAGARQVPSLRQDGYVPSGGRRAGTHTQPSNNAIERMIGLLLNIRSKTVRGFAKRDNTLRFVHLPARLWEGRLACELKAVC